jgi:sulfur-oxidizing protein SoxX
MWRSLVLTALLLDMPGALASAGDAIQEPLTDLAGVALSMETGATVFADRDQGHCVLCHQVASLDAPFQGDVGPALDGIGSRLTPSQIRYRIVDASMLNPDTVMPPYYRTDDLYQVAVEHQGQTALSAEQIEQLVYYLSGLVE